MHARLSLLLILTFFLFSCGGDSSTNPQDNSLNLLSNTSFETPSNQPDYSHWWGTAYLSDSVGNRLNPLVKDAPPGGGVWCVELEPQWLPEGGYTESAIAGQSGTHIYKVSAWMKMLNKWHGSLSLEQWRNGKRISTKSLSDTSSVWKAVSLTDTLNIVAEDSIKVHLSAGSTQIVLGKVRFDLVRLERVDP